MTQWIISAVVLIVFALAMPALVRSSKSSASRKSRLGSGSAGLGDALSGFLDPAKRVSIERIEKQKDIGNAAQGAIGEKDD